MVSALAALLAAGAAGAQTPAPAAASSPAPISQPSAVAPPSPADSPAAAAACCLIPSGTLVEIELTRLVSSRLDREGEHFPLRLAADLQVDGVVVVAAGATGQGEVIDAAAGGIAGRPGKLVLAARSLDIGAVRLPLRSFRLAGAGRDDSKAIMAVMMASTAVGILAMGVQGGNIDFPAGTRAIAKVAADTFIATAAPVATPTPSAPPPAVAAPPASKETTP